MHCSCRRRWNGASSLVEQLAQDAALQLGRRAVRAATGPQEIEEQPFEVEVLAARRAVGEVLTDLLLYLGVSSRSRYSYRCSVHSRQFMWRFP